MRSFQKLYLEWPFTWYHCSSSCSLLADKQVISYSGLKCHCVSPLCPLVSAPCYHNTSIKPRPSSLVWLCLPNHLHTAGALRYAWYLHDFFPLGPVFPTTWFLMCPKGAKTMLPLFFPFHSPCKNMIPWTLLSSVFELFWGALKCCCFPSDVSC